MNAKVQIAVIAIVFLVIGIAVGFGLKTQTTSTTPSTNTTAQQSTSAKTLTTIALGGLFPLSGDLQTFGQQNSLALQLAASDINAFLNSSGLPYQVKVFIEDTQTNPNVALQKLQSLYAQGVKFIVGPMASSEVKNIMGFANSNHIIIFSPSSTSPALAIPNDFIFRLVVDDRMQGEALAQLAKYYGLKHVVIVWRGDDWGDNLANSTIANMALLGIDAITGPRYSVQASDYTSEVNQLANTVSSLIGKYGESSVGVVLISFEEGVQFIDQASQYQSLSSVRWIGTDGIAKSGKLISDPVAASFAVKTNFTATIAGTLPNPKYENLTARFIQSLGTEPISYAYNTYDIAWILTLSIITAGDYSPDKVIKILPTIASNYYGVTGWTQLNANGDRAYANYFIYAVDSQQGQYVWSYKGMYDTATKSFTFS
ncbi:MAG: ABC transporter substrate-binding protein [Fervidicoccaceae archaeon]